MSTQATIVQAGFHAASETSPPPGIGVKAKGIGLAFLGFAAFAGALLATLPATLVAKSLNLGPEVGVTGTAWSGEATLANGDRLAWNADLLGSILSLSLRSKIDVRGELTQLDARASASIGSLTISDIAGVASWSLLRSAFPGIEVDCNVGLRLSDAKVVIDGPTTTLAGRASSSAGTCTHAGVGNPFDVPAADVVSTTADSASRIRISLASDPSALLAEIAIGAKGDFTATVQPIALNLSPGAQASGPVVYEMRAP